MSATRELRRDHEIVRRFEVLVDACQSALRAGDEVPLDEIGEIIGIMEGFLDAVHHAREEGSYFPCAGAYGRSDEIRRFLVEHEFGRRVAAKAAAHLRRWRAGEDGREPVSRFFDAYAVYLRDHVAREDAFFEQAGAELSAEEEAEMYDYFMSAGARERGAADDARARIAALERSGWFGRWRRAA